jgi:hypothetical protein
MVAVYAVPAKRTVSRAGNLDGAPASRRKTGHSPARRLNTMGEKRAVKA